MQHALPVELYLASQSPRRRALLKELGFPVKIVRAPGIEEIYPGTLTGPEIPVFLAKMKAEAYDELLPENAILITADTIVWTDNSVLGKPEGKAEAVEMLERLSGRMHQVFTGVCLKYRNKVHSFYDTTNVYFKPLSSEEIDYYVENNMPYDKAGAYGIQEWIGFIGVERIEGSYFNVMGLPTHRLYTEILKVAADKSEPDLSA